MRLEILVVALVSVRSREVAAMHSLNGRQGLEPLLLLLLLLLLLFLLV